MYRLTVNRHRVKQDEFDTYLDYINYPLAEYSPVLLFRLAKFVLCPGNYRRSLILAEIETDSNWLDPMINAIAI